VAVPDVPAIAEYVPGYEVVSSQALFIPAKTPREIVRKISADTNGHCPSRADSGHMDA
jgi:tripartite-type tricarboxylate transporter receptor subunit TctC